MPNTAEVLMRLDGATQQFQQEFQSSVAAVKQMAQAVRELNASFGGYATSGTKALGANDSLTKSVAASNVALEKQGQSFASSGFRFAFYAITLLSVGQSLINTIFLKGFFQAASAFEDVTTRIRAAALDQGISLLHLRLQLQDVVRGTIFGAKDAAEGVLELVKAGLSVTDSFKALPGVLQLATAVGAKVGEVANFAATSLAAFNLTAADVPMVMGVAAKAILSTVFDFKDLQIAMGEAGATLGAFGQSYKDTVAAVSGFGAVGFNPSQAGTIAAELQAKLLDDKVRTVLRQLRISLTDTKGPRPFLSVIGEFTDKLDQYVKSRLGNTPQAKTKINQILIDLFQIRAARGVAAVEQLAKKVAPGGTVQQGMEEWVKLFDDTGKSLEELVDLMGKDFPRASQILGNQVTNIATQLGTPMIDALTPVLNLVSKLLIKFQSLTGASEVLQTGLGGLILTGSGLLAAAGFLAVFGGIFGFIINRANDFKTQLAAAGIVNPKSIGEIFKHGFTGAAGKEGLFSGLGTIANLARGPLNALRGVMLATTFVMVAYRIHLKQIDKGYEEIAKTMNPFLRGLEDGIELITKTVLALVHAIKTFWDFIKPVREGTGAFFEFIKNFPGGEAVLHGLGEAVGVLVGATGLFLLVQQLRLVTGVLTLLQTKAILAGRALQFFLIGDFFASSNRFLGRLAFSRAGAVARNEAGQVLPFTLTNFFRARGIGGIGTVLGALSLGSSGLVQKVVGFLFAPWRAFNKAAGIEFAKRAAALPRESVLLPFLGGSVASKLAQSSKAIPVTLTQGLRLTGARGILPGLAALTITPIQGILSGLLSIGKALFTLRGLLIGSGIGALVLVIITLLTNTEKLADIWDRIAGAGTPLALAWGKLMQNFSTAGRQLLPLFDTILDLAGRLSAGLVTALGATFEALARVLTNPIVIKTLQLLAAAIIAVLNVISFGLGKIDSFIKRLSNDRLGFITAPLHFLFDPDEVARDNPELARSINKSLSQAGELITAPLATANPNLSSQSTSNQTITNHFNVTVPPGTPETVGKQIAKVAAEEYKRQMEKQKDEQKEKSERFNILNRVPLFVLP